MGIKQESKVVHKKVLKANYEDGASWASFREMGFHKMANKEPTVPVEIKLHTQQRAAKRAIFNNFVSTKLYFIEKQKKREEKLQKMLEEEKIKHMRKEMVPKAQLMPYFDKPFSPQRSHTPLTIPREPCLRILNNKSGRCISCNEHYFEHNSYMKAI